MPSHILVAIKDPYGGRTLALNRAQEWALAHEASVTLFHSLYLPAVANAHYYAPKQLEADIAAEIARCKGALQKLAKPLIAAGIEVHLRVRWDYPVHESIVREVRREKIDLLIVDSHRHGVLARLVLSNTDWQLIRLCPCPVLLVKGRKPYKGSIFAVSVDPMHANDKPAALDQKLVEHAKRYSQPFKAAVHLVHYFLPLMPIPAGLMVDPVPLPLDIQQQHTKLIKKAFQHFTQTYKLGPRHTHLKEGTASEDLPGFVKQLKANVLVMGAVSRSTLKRLFIGATAEQVIDAVECDVLVVKSDEFKCPVPVKAYHQPIVLPPI